MHNQNPIDSDSFETRIHSGGGGEAQADELQLLISKIESSPNFGKKADTIEKDCCTIDTI